jgi:hypothetical protein
MRVAIGCIGTLWLLLASSAHAEPLGPGMRLPEIRLSDQHDVETTIGADVQVVLFTRDMDAGKIVKEALAKDGKEQLEGAGAVYVSDISGMPRLIAKMFALPSMRKRPYRMILDRDGKATADFPSEKDKVTFLRIEVGAITGIEYVESAGVLSAMLAHTPARKP